MVKIEVFGSGCLKCMKTEENCRKAVRELGIDAEVTHVYDFVEMMKRGITSSPAVAIDGRLVVSGRVPEVEEIKRLLGEKRRADW
ncbi:MAG: thioredoxin family protein [Candidatus Hadarchaeales archaeon]